MRNTTSIEENAAANATTTSFLNRRKDSNTFICAQPAHATFRHVFRSRHIQTMNSADTVHATSNVNFADTVHATFRLSRLARTNTTDNLITIRNSSSNNMLTQLRNTTSITATGGANLNTQNRRASFVMLPHQRKDFSYFHLC